MEHRHERVEDLDMSDVGGDGGRTLPPGFSFDEAVAPRRDDSIGSNRSSVPPPAGGSGGSGADGDEFETAAPAGVLRGDGVGASRHAERKRTLQRTDSVKWNADGGVGLDVAAQSKAIQNYIDLEVC